MKKWMKPAIATMTEKELAQVILASACSNRFCTWAVISSIDT
jgi:hypothetical protein